MSEERLFPNRETLGADGTVRKAHYGEGEQPWDTMKRLGWANDFAAGCVLRYLRRSKDAVHSLESAKWYLARLYELCGDDDEIRAGLAQATVHELYSVLTKEEMRRLAIIS